jgi:hypothetical protein
MSPLKKEPQRRQVRQEQKKSREGLGDLCGFAVKNLLFPVSLNFR